MFNWMKKAFKWVKRQTVVVASVAVIGVCALTVAKEGVSLLQFFGGKFPDLSGVAYATFTPPTIETENILLIAGAVFTAIAAIWFIHKGIKLLNKS